MTSGRIEVVDTNKLESCLSYWRKDYQNWETEACSYSYGEWNWPAGVTDQTAWIVVCAACSPAIQVNQTCIKRRQSVSFTVQSYKEQEWGGWKPLFIWSEPISSDKRNCNWQLAYRHVTLGHRRCRAGNSDLVKTVFSHRIFPRTTQGYKGDLNAKSKSESARQNALQIHHGNNWVLQM